MNKVNQVIADYLLTKIEESGQLPWTKPWSQYQEKPQNIVSGKAYRGINSVILGFGQSPFWLTMNQVNAAGGRVKKGSKSAPCVYYKLGESKTQRDSNGDPETYAMLRYFRVFNAADCDGIDLPEHGIELNDNKPIVQCEAIVAGYQNAPPISSENISNAAYYSSSSDKIVMPKIQQFNAPEDYYSTLFHEVGHSTGHDSRLNRKLGNLFGSHGYSKEELVAEFTAAFLCREAGIDGNIDQSAAYLKGWLSVLRENPKWLMWGAQQAQKAYDHVVGIE